MGVVCCFLVVYYNEAEVFAVEASAEHETNQLYKYYTFLLLSQLFYQCYGFNTAIDILYEYKWSLLFSYQMRRVNDDICFPEQAGWTLCFLFLYSIVTENQTRSSELNGKNEVRTEF